MVALSQELTGIDLFAGAGGLTTGAKRAGVKMLWAANHWEPAVICHRRNHPETDHVCQDLRQADWRNVPDHHFLLASPECRGHTKAKGKERPHHDSSRATAWAIVDCVEVKQPLFLVIENVPEFRRWRHYQRWRECLAEDYWLTENILDAADLSVPQNRVRLFLVGVHRSVSKCPITITRCHLPQRPASDIINWRSPGWCRIDKKGRSPKTLMRIQASRVLFNREPFVLPYFGSAKHGRSLDRPLGTVTTKDRYALIQGEWMRMLTVEEYQRAMGFPADYWLPPVHSIGVKLLGNAVVPQVAQYLINQIRRFLPRTKKTS